MSKYRHKGMGCVIRFVKAFFNWRNLLFHMFPIPVSTLRFWHIDFARWDGFQLQIVEKLNLHNFFKVNFLTSNSLMQNKALVYQKMGSKRLIFLIKLILILFFLKYFLLLTYYLVMVERNQGNKLKLVVSIYCFLGVVFCSLSLFVLLRGHERKDADPKGLSDAARFRSMVLFINETPLAKKKT